MEADVVVVGALVRPDGHLAWRGTAASALRTWLDAPLGKPAGVLGR